MMERANDELRDNWKQTFLVIWVGQFFSILTSSIVGYAITFWLSLKTGSAEVLASLFAATILPQVLLGPFVGVYVDRWDRKRTMIISDSFIAVCTVVLVVLLRMGIESLAAIYILQICRSLGTAFHTPSMQASVPLLAPESQLTRIAGVNQMIYSVSTIAGPALGALAITVTSIENVLLLDVFGALIAAGSLLFIVIPRPKRDNPVYHFLTELKESVRAIAAVKGLRWLFLFAVMFTFVVMPVSVIFPLMTLQHFGGDSFGMSLIEILWGVGMLLGGFIIALIKMPYRKIIVLNLTYILLGATFLFSGLLSSEQFIIFCILTFLGGIFGSIFHSMFVSILQIKIAPEVLGRVLSLYGSISLAPTFLGLFGVSMFVDMFGLLFVFIIAGLVIIAIGFSSFFIPSLHRMKD